MVREAWRSRRSSVIFMAAVLVIAGLLAVKVVFFPEQSRESAAPSVAVSAGSVAPSVAVAAGSVGADGRAVCDVKVPAGKEFSAEVPSDFTWARLPIGVDYPVSRTYGPTVQVGHTGQCFAHNPTGAALAAINAMMANSNIQASEAERRALMSSQRDTSDSNMWHPAADDPQVEAYYLGYQIQGYSTERATIRVCMRYSVPQNFVACLPIRMVWEDGDWRLDSSKSEMTASVVTDSADFPTQIFRRA